MDAKDIEFSKFHVWQDKNSNGISEAGELSTLVELDIARIRLTSDEGTGSEHENYTIFGTGSYELIDGSERMLGDIGFKFEGSFLDADASQSGVTIDLGDYENHHINILGSQYDDVLRGDARANHLTGGVGNDTLDGGSGADTAHYVGVVESFSFTYNVDGSLTVSDSVGKEGTDTLRNIEQLNFHGSSWEVDLARKQLRMIDAIAGTPILDDNGVARIIKIPRASASDGTNLG